MSTIQMAKPSNPEPANNLVGKDHIKKGKKMSIHYETKNSHFCAKDMMGLSWILFDNVENTLFKGTKYSGSISSVC